MQTGYYLDVEHFQDRAFVKCCGGWGSLGV